MSSAEDTSPCPVSPTASPSEQYPEELPIELEGREAPQPNLPLALKTNMVAQEVRVNATGTHPGNHTSAPELFTEETTSLLVSEHGGVIRLAAAVAPGQLLLLTNIESKAEIVVQVKRKRAHKPTSCYVELEFAETVPRFWGMEFSAAAALLPKDARDAEAAALVISAEATTDEPGEPPAAPTAEQVQALKREVQALRDPQRALQTPVETDQSAAPASDAIPDASPAPALGPVPSTESNSNIDWREVSSTTNAAKALRIEHPPLPMHLAPSEEALMPEPAPDFTMPLPNRRRSLQARGNFTPGFVGAALRLALGVALLASTVGGVAWYKHWIPWKSAAQKSPVSVPASASNVNKSLPLENPDAAEARPDLRNAKVGSDEPVTTAGRSSETAAQPNSPAPETIVAIEPGAQPSVSHQPAARPTVKKSAAAATLAGKHSAGAPAGKNASNSVPLPAADSDFVPPKLLKSVRALATMDAVRDFETGNVVIDAVVGTSGEVNFVSVISGPPSLRNPAIVSLKQYLYEPATRHGQPVPAHVTITIHFRFEP